MTVGVHPLEIQHRLRKGYLERLAVRVKRMRKQLALREWQELKSECRQLRAAAEGFGFPAITELAMRCEAKIPDGEVSRARALPMAKEAAETLIAAIDDVLVADSVNRPGSSLSQPAPAGK